MMDFSNTSFEKLLFTNEQLFKNTTKAQMINDKVNNTRLNQLTDLNLGKQLPKTADFPYSYDINLYKYGKGQIGSSCNAPLYGKPQTIRPFNDNYNGYNSDLLLRNANRDVDVSGRIFKNRDLALPKAKIISS